MEYFYVLTTDTLDEIEHYGIAVALLHDDSLIIISTYSYISTNRETIEELVNKCNSLELSVYHLLDVIEDFLSMI